jgi:C-methyltransferase-like protein/putative zinc binding protein/methyltransferase family protein
MLEEIMQERFKTLAPAERISCRFCGALLKQTFVDLGMSPLCESYVSAEQLNQAEVFYPLRVYVCDLCFLVQLQEYVSAESIFAEYAYFSSFSDSWLAHAKKYVDQMTERFNLNRNSFVVELASNDGYLLQYFVACGIPVLGIEPATNIAAAALKKNIPTLIKFFNRELACELAAVGKRADLLLGNNVLAQVPNLNSFVAGMKILLAERGVITLEFPHLLQLMEANQFDTIYHEHFSYFSLITVEAVLAMHELRIFDVEELSTHGGSLRIYATHSSDDSQPVRSHVEQLRARERSYGLTSLERYESFAGRVMETKRAILEFLIKTKRDGKSIAGYGAPGKGNTLLNYCGIRTDFLDYTVDRNPYKQDKFLPGTHIPIYPPERIRQTKPSYLFILPWNLKKEIVQQNGFIREWGGQFVVPIPEIEVF